MPTRIREFCQETGQPIPEVPAEIVRCILESFTLKYRWVIERLEALLARPIPCIPVVGGGSRHALLCQWTADAAGRPVLAGPTEATALGNPIVQAMAPGHLSDLPEAPRGDPALLRPSSLRTPRLLRPGGSLSALGRPDPSRLKVMKIGAAWRVAHAGSNSDRRFPTCSDGGARPGVNWGSGGDPAA
jgi:hypothetical protein